MIHLIQWMCPRRHCLLAIAYDPVDGNYEEAVARLQKGAADIHAAPRCAVCDATEQTLFYTDEPTRFTTLEEALPHLLASQVAQLKTRAMLDASRN